ncbi:MAG: nucleoside 2-deoxyribosyltransferase [Nanoarchaeota archaeon]|nr:nucleoside 2-deoxyribosyltransferase [Nanoarchaeota archaeon]
MRYYIAYRFTDEDPKELKENLEWICNILAQQGHDNYCSFFDAGMVDIGNKNVLERGFKEIDKSDSLLVIIKSEHKSEGMLIEIGYALSMKKKIILLIKKGVATTFVREIADKVIEFDNLKEIKKLDI